ncbi:MAG: alpha/beta hydrolase [Elainellaceae cyanobacterium]
MTKSFFVAAFSSNPFSRRSLSAEQQSQSPQPAPSERSPQSIRHRRRLSFATMLIAVFGGLAGLGLAQSASAAERVVLKYRWLQRSVAVSDLSTLAETGEASSELESYLDLAGRSPEQLQGDLNRNVNINPVRLDRLLNSPLGNVALDQITPAIHTRSGNADRQALRAAMVLAASDDENISIIELLEEYPTSEVYLDGDRIVEAYQQIASIQEQLERWTGWLDF